MVVDGQSNCTMSSIVLGTETDQLVQEGPFLISETAEYMPESKHLIMLSKRRPIIAGSSAPSTAPQPLDRGEGTPTL